MFEDIRRNKIKSGFIVSAFILVITLIMYYICLAFDFGVLAVPFALAISILISWASYYNSDKIILAVTKARPATMEENKKVIQILEALMISSGLSHMPRLYIVDDPQPNAFATGRNPKNSIICVTSGLLEKLEYYELEGVIAHEMAHIKNYDILLSAVVTVMVGFVVMLSDICTRAMFWGSGSNRDRENNSGNVIFLIIGLVLLIVAPILGKLMQMSMSRRREFLADATAIEFTRNPDGLISALRKLEEDTNELQAANKATENMYIINPFKKNREGRKKASLFSTHPSIDDRVHALQNIQ
jgi:heat shock protein HtpX